MRAWESVSGILGALSLLLASGLASADSVPVTVECSLKMRYAVYTERPVVDAVNRYICEGKVIASSDVDATESLATRQVVFGLDDCPRLPDTVVFGDQDVTEVRKLRGDRARAHVFSGECERCVISTSTDVAAPPLDAGHFDATFVVRPLALSLQEDAIYLPAGRGSLALRSERTDDMIVRGMWTARRCRVVPTPEIFCGGIAGIPCPDGMDCVDYPDDECDPGQGHADCIGICVSGTPGQ